MISFRFYILPDNIILTEIKTEIFLRIINCEDNA